MLSTKSAQTVEEALAGINEEDFPKSMDQREKFCMEQLSAGEVLFTQGASLIPRYFIRKPYHDTPLTDSLFVW